MLSPMRGNLVLRHNVRDEPRCAQSQSRRRIHLELAGIARTPPNAEARTRVVLNHFGRRTMKSGAGGAKPAVTAYSEAPNPANVVGTFVAGFDTNGSVISSVITPDKWSGSSSTTVILFLKFCATYSVFPSSSRPSALHTSPPPRSIGSTVYVAVFIQ